MFSACSATFEKFLFKYSKCLIYESRALTPQEGISTVRSGTPQCISSVVRQSRKRRETQRKRGIEINELKKKEALNTSPNVLNTSLTLILLL